MAQAPKFGLNHTPSADFGCAKKGVHWCSLDLPQRLLHVTSSTDRHADSGVHAAPQARTDTLIKVSMAFLGLRVRMCALCDFCRSCCTAALSAGAAPCGLGESNQGPLWQKAVGVQGTHSIKLSCMLKVCTPSRYALHLVELHVQGMHSIKLSCMFAIGVFGQQSRIEEHPIHPGRSEPWHAACIESWLPVLESNERV